MPHLDLTTRVTSFLRLVCLSLASATVAMLLMGGSVCTTTTTGPYILSGPTTRPTTAPSTRGVSVFVPAVIDPVVISMDTQEQDQAGFSDWVDEIGKRFPGGCIILVGHGGEVAGKWCLCPTPGDDPDLGEPFAGCPVPAEWLATMCRLQYGWKLPIIILSCNAANESVDIPDTYYAPSEVWITPDDCDDPMDRFMRHFADPNVVGSLDGFKHVPALSLK